jgi:RecA/RadA recombinase
MSPDFSSYETPPEDWMKGNPGQTHTPRGGLPMMFFADIAPALEGNDFVEGLLTTSSFVVVYGEPGSGKTFWVLDLCLHIASGRAWNDREVEGGPVVYVALEGGRGIDNRVTAARRRMNLPADTPFVLIKSPIDLRTPDADAAKLAASIKEVERTFGVPVKLVAIDTLFRALAGGNENASEDMGALVRNADWLRHETGACVLFIHHCGKEVARGMRGHSSLKAATDTEIEVTRDADSSVAKVTRQRDLETTGTFAFRLDSETLGEDQRGKPVQSCIVVSADAPAAAPSKRKLTDNAAAMLDLFHNVVARDGEPIQPTPEMPMVTGVPRKSLREALVQAGWFSEGQLSDDGKVGKAGLTTENNGLRALNSRGFLAFNRDYAWQI